tara:strand:- start:874 stop:2013 length:1140 start_codon:yes stop_codon:yes gene_type:complete
MADQLFFSRDTKVYIKRTGATPDPVYFEVPVLGDFTFSQGTNTSEITLSEAADSSGNSRRARQVFNDSFAPAEWSFSTYARPFVSAGGATRAVTAVNGEYITDTNAYHHAVEEALWDAFVSNGADQAGLTADATDLDVLFSASNKTTVGTFDLYFVLDADNSGSELVYKVADACVNEATIDFDIDGICTINWSGFGSLITEQGTTLDHTPGTDTITEGIVSTTNYIRNKLTTLDLVATAPGSDTYALVLTGGSITFSNNITYLTPETIGSVNQPLGHVTGTRSVSGNFTVYLDNDTLAGAELFEDLVEATTTVTTNHALTFGIGGGTAGTPRLQIGCPTAHLEIPQHQIDDVIGLDVNFHGIPSTIDGTDEATVKYIVT